mgnify:CR=1 FL=1
MSLQWWQPAFQHHRVTEKSRKDIIFWNCGSDNIVLISSKQASWTCCCVLLWPLFQVGTLEYNSTPFNPLRIRQWQKHLPELLLLQIISEEAMAVGLAITSDGGNYNGRMTPFVVLSCMMAAMGGVIFGYDIGISGFFSSNFVSMFHRREQKNLWWNDAWTSVEWSRHTGVELYSNFYSSNIRISYIFR